MNKILRKTSRKTSRKKSRKTSRKNRELIKKKFKIYTTRSGKRKGWEKEIYTAKKSSIIYFVSWYFFARSA